MNFTRTSSGLSKGRINPAVIPGNKTPSVNLGSFSRGDGEDAEQKEQPSRYRQIRESPDAPDILIVIRVVSSAAYRWNPALFADRDHARLRSTTPPDGSINFSESSFFERDPRGRMGRGKKRRRGLITGRYEAPVRSRVICRSF